jgi:hypothetical protein
MFVEFSRYLYPEDVEGGRTKKNHKSEVFQTNLIYTVNIRAFVSHLEVVHQDEFSGRVLNSSRGTAAKRKRERDNINAFFHFSFVPFFAEPKDLLMCNSMYFPETKTFQTFVVADNNHVNMEIKSSALPTHWPSNVTFVKEAQCSSGRISDPALEGSFEIKTEEGGGLVALKAFEQGDFLGEFAGELQQVQGEPAPNEFQRILHFDKETKTAVILDYKRMGNHFRFMKTNDQVPDKKPNVELVPIWLENAKWKLIVRATTQIRPRTELIAPSASLTTSI